MFLRLVAIVLLVAFAMQTFQKNMIVLDYFANTEAFAQNCENKARPVLKCKGKCQMLKKLQAEEKKEQKNPEHKGENKASTPNTLPPLPLQAALAMEAINTIYPPFPVIAECDQSYPILHPPALV